MTRDLAKVALVVVAAISVLIVFGIVRGRSASTEPPAGAPTAAQSTVPVQTTTEPPQVVTAAPSGSVSESADQPSWAPTVVGFGRAFSDTKASRQEWVMELAPYADEGVRQSLATFDRGQIPAQQFDSYEQLDSEAGQLAVQVNYSDGWLMVLYLSNHDDRWLVSAYDQLEQ